LPFKSIKKASTAAKAGSTVHVAPGTYEGGFTTTANDVTYVSDVKWGAKIASGGGDTAWNNKGDNVTINGFEVDGSNARWRLGILTTGTDSIVENNKVHDIGTNPATAGSSNGGAGIYGDGYKGDTDITIRNNEVFDIGPEGRDSSLIHGIYQTTTGTVSNNLVHDNAGAGIHLWHDARDVDVLDNTVYDSNQGIWVGGGDNYNYSGPADNMNVANNTVYDNRDYGIVEGGNTGTQNTYTGNSVYENGTNWDLQNGLKPRNASSQAPQAYTEAPTLLADQPVTQDDWLALSAKA
jgi:hypothetical protein